MIFPENNEFTYFFANSHLSTTTNPDGYNKIELIKPEVAGDIYNEVKFPGINAYIKKDCKISFKAIQEKISKSLVRSGHIVSEEIFNAVFAIILSIPKNDNTLHNINKILSNLTTGSLNQFLILNVSNQGFHLKLNDFIIGDIDYKKIEYYCEKMRTTDFHKKYSNSIRGKFGVSREHFKIILLKLDELYKLTSNWDSLNRLLDIYFLAISREKQKEFYTKFDESQATINLFCHNYYDLKNWMLGSNFGSFLSIYTHIGTNKVSGWVVPYKIKHIIELDNSMPKNLIEFNSKQYEFTTFGDNEIDSLFKKFISFCSKAVKYRLEGRLSESLLHYVIALDMLFGEKESSTQSVTQRVAFLVHNQLNYEFDKMVKEIKHYYDLRSKYVHQGAEISEVEGDRIREICIELFKVYLNLHKNKFSSTFNYIQWLGKIDLGVASVNANEKISDELFLKCGIVLLPKV